MICCISPSFFNYQESVNAIRYIIRAKNIQNYAKINSISSTWQLEELKQFTSVILLNYYILIDY